MIIASEVGAVPGQQKGESCPHSTLAQPALTAQPNRCMAVAVLSYFGEKPSGAKGYHRAHHLSSSALRTRWFPGEDVSPEALRAERPSWSPTATEFGRASIAFSDSASCVELGEGIIVPAAESGPTGFAMSADESRE